MAGFDFRGAAPKARKGIPVSRLAFCGGRTAVELAAHGGFTSIRHYGNQRIGDAEIFVGDPLAAWGQMFRMFVDFGNNEQYLTEFNDSVFYPFGFDSAFDARGMRFRHRLTVLNDAVLFELESDDGSDFSLMISNSNPVARQRTPRRKWIPFTTQGGFALGAVEEFYPPPAPPKPSLTQNRVCEEPRETRTVFGVGGVDDLSFASSLPSFPKDYFRSRAHKGYAAQALVFGPDEKSVVRRLREILPQLSERAAAERRTFANSQRCATQWKTPRPILNSFLRNMPEIMRSFEVKDIPGAVRAADSGYWVWGWDSMVHSDGLMLAGEWDSIRARLEYYRASADPVRGIFHAATTAGKPMLTMAPAAQTIYCVMLYNHFRFSGDRATLAEFYPFAVKLMQRVREDEHPETGLYCGVSLYPDAPEDLGQDGEDLSSFNNSILFQAFRVMAELAGALGKKEDAADFSARADRLGKGFRRHLYDASTGYFFDSISARDLTPRCYYPVYAVLFLTPFARELVAKIEKTVGTFMRDAFTQRIGVSMFPRRDKVFYSDGNQLGMYMTVTEGFHRQLMREIGEPDTLLPFIEREWGCVRLAEALTCEAVNAGLTPDNPGRKQQFTAASFYSLTAGLFCGLEFGCDALRFLRPTRAEEGWCIGNLRWKNARLSISYRGKGALRRVVFDGMELPGNTLPAELLKKKHEIIVYLGEAE